MASIVRTQPSYQATSINISNAPASQPQEPTNGDMAEKSPPTRVTESNRENSHWHKITKAVKGFLISNDPSQRAYTFFIVGQLGTLATMMFQLMAAKLTEFNKEHELLVKDIASTGYAIFCALMVLGICLLIRHWNH